MNALFYFTGYSHARNRIIHYAMTVSDGPHDRFAQAMDIMRKSYPELSHWTGSFICITSDEVFKEL